jgi:ketosteroid isomerase-like protein
MSDADLEARLRGLYAAFNRGDIEGAVALLPPDVVAYDAPDLPDSQTYHGRAGLAGALRTLWEMFDGPEVEVLDLRFGGDRAVALLRARGRGVAGGVPVEVAVAHVFTVRDGEPVEMRVFIDHEQGLREAGLDPG